MRTVPTGSPIFTDMDADGRGRVLACAVLSALPAPAAFQPAPAGH